MSTSSIELVCGTDIGLLRSRNEDNVAIWPEHSLAILADGIGGNNAGQLASKVAVDATYENWINTVANMGGTGSGFSGSVSGDLLMVAVSIANHQIHDLVKAEADLDGSRASRLAEYMRPAIPAPRPVPPEEHPSAATDRSKRGPKLVQLEKANQVLASSSLGES